MNNRYATYYILYLQQQTYVLSGKDEGPGKSLERKLIHHILLSRENAGDIRKIKPYCNRVDGVYYLQSSVDMWEHSRMFWNLSTYSH